MEIKEKTLTAKQQAFVDAFTDSTGDTYNNIERSMLKAGYAKSYARHRNSRVLANVGVKEAIRANTAKRQAGIEHNYDIAIKELNTYINYLESQAAKGNVSAVTAITSLLREKNDIAGLHKQRFIDESEQRRQLTESEEIEARRIAAIRLHEAG